MEQYKFKVGQTVRIRADAPIGPADRAGSYEVIRTFPVERDGLVTYRIKPKVGGQERVVTEDLLTLH